MREASDHDYRFSRGIPTAPPITAAYSVFIAPMRNRTGDTTMQMNTRNRLAIVASAAALTLLTACSRQDDTVASNSRADGGMTTSEPAPATTVPSTTAPSTTAPADTPANTVESTAERAGNAAERGVETAVTATGDASLTAKVKTALITAPDLSAMKIDVDTSNGVVTLKGQVKNTDEKVKAEQVASNVTGVTQVVNNLQIANS